MPIFTQQLRRIDPRDTASALKAMEAHIKYIQEQLEYTLMNLDSRNISEINTDETSIGSGTGGSSISGNSITLKGVNGETFEAGVVDGVFRFSLKGKDGEQIFLLTNTGDFYIPNKAAITIDGGTW